MKTIHLRPGDPDRDFGQIAALFSSQQDEPTTEADLKKEIETDGDRILYKVAEDEQGELMGFYWMFRSRMEEGLFLLNLVVKPEQRHQGAGRLLYEDMAQALEEAGAKKLRIDIRDNCPEGKTFAERRGFTERMHSIGMELNLRAFDERPYEAIITQLKSEGFRFTSMEELGNTEEAQRKLYALNDTTAFETAGGMEEHPWSSFEDFQKRVCGSEWYNPAGQLVVIDSSTGTWAAMSAITRFKWADFAYNLFTGVDQRYRGRKLAQAVKVMALRFARDILKVNIVRTDHNTLNNPMLAIDRKLGYNPLPGTYIMEKVLFALPVPSH